MSDSSCPPELVTEDCWSRLNLEQYGRGMRPRKPAGAYKKMVSGKADDDIAETICDAASRSRPTSATNAARTPAAILRANPTRADRHTMDPIDEVPRTSPSRTGLRTLDPIARRRSVRPRVMNDNPPPTPVVDERDIESISDVYVIQDVDYVDVNLNGKEPIRMRVNDLPSEITHGYAPTRVKYDGNTRNDEEFMVRPTDIYPIDVVSLNIIKKYVDQLANQLRDVISNNDDEHEIRNRKTTLYLKYLWMPKKKGKRKQRQETATNIPHHEEKKQQETATNTPHHEEKKTTRSNLQRQWRRQRNGSNASRSETLDEGKC
jgi:hypothetical protein